MKLIVGLGNPGAGYANSPHNLGFRVLDTLVSSLGAAFAHRFSGRLAEARLDAIEVLLLEPLTYMNRSGRSVRQALAHYGLAVPDVLVVHDELDLPPGSVKLKRGGGDAGHNGLKSVTAELATREFARLRLGVGRPPAGTDVSEFLLSPMSAELLQQLEPGFERAHQAIRLWARDGLERAMNLVNRASVADPATSGRPD